MAFVVDGSEWCFDGWSAEDIDAAFGVLLSRVEVARSRGERVWVGDDLQTQSVLGELSVWDLWSPGAPVQLPVELHQELAAFLGAAHRYLDEEDWPPGMDDTQVRIDDDPAVENVDVAWAHHHTRAGRAVACLGLHRSGVYKTETTGGVAVVHWVTNEQGHRDFFRAAISVEHDSEETLQRFAPHAYPDIYFLAEVWRGLSDFKGGYTAVRQEPRERVLNGRTLYCHWHGKIEPHINRIHIHHPVPESDGKIIIAIFHAHLPLPGDR